MTGKEKIKLWTKGRLFEIMNGIGENDAKNILTDLLSFVDSMQEEPVSKELEEAAKNYMRSQNPPIWGLYYGFKAGAQWQKEQMILITKT